MAELCDLFPEDTSCQTGGDGTTTDPDPVVDPGITDLTDTGDDVSDE